MTEKLEIKPLEQLDACVEAPPSKAHTLRALFLAALAEGKSEIISPLIADDQMRAIEALRQLGVWIEQCDKRIEINGTGGRLVLPNDSLYVGMSGVSMHFLLSLVSLAPQGTVRIDGAERMRTGRPVQNLLDSLNMLGVRAQSVFDNGCLPVDVRSGGMRGGRAVVRGATGSQYFSSILISAPYAKTDVILESEGDLVSKPYIDITIDCMARFGVEAVNEAYRFFRVHAGQRYRGIAYRVEGDFSNASYFLGAAAITGGRIRVQNLQQDSRQGDKIFIEILKRMGCKVQWGKGFVEIKGGDLSGVEENVANCPDLVPGLAVIASFARGTSVFRGVKGLRFKECDRLAAVITELRKMGVDAIDGPDELRVVGTVHHHGAEISTYNDHRMAMSFSMAGLRTPGVVILQPEVVSKSFPDFYELWDGLYD